MQRALLNRATMRVAVNPLIQLKETAAVQQFNLNKNMKKKIIAFIAFPLFVCAAAYAQGITWIPASPMNKARILRGRRATKRQCSGGRRI